MPVKRGRLGSCCRMGVRARTGASSLALPREAIIAVGGSGDDSDVDEKELSEHLQKATLPSRPASPPPPPPHL
eukprot:1139890-Pyramimonas_sp.AAC.1